MYPRRDFEPDYAVLPAVDAPARNRYGKPIQLVEETDPLAGQSLNINGDTRVGCSPDRYKQHGFYFNADNCIACHACESACAEKNATPAHLAFRSVGYLEGGTYPAAQRLNISMACNHCDDPVCLKGCPTRAYTKFAEYGAVLQDPDICFGCGYCTWVCPYNAPQLDPVAGHVSKCNMCVDRLEVGLKPACVAACLGGALDFGVIETTPANNVELATQIPGFPDPSITYPNIRFQQQRSLPRELRRSDSTPIRYVQDAQNPLPGAGITSGQGAYHSASALALDKPMQWNLHKLRSREDPLVVFTLITQAVIGAFITLFLAPLSGLQELSIDAHPLAYPVTLFSLIALQTFALVISTLHLGRPHRFYRAFNNLRYSPVSREVAAVAVFYNLLGAYAVLSAFPVLFAWLPAAVVAALRAGSGTLAIIAGPVALYFMQRIYRIRARPYWNHWQVLTSFFGSMLTLGPLLVALLFVPLLMAQGIAYTPLIRMLALPMIAGLVLEGWGLYRHAAYLQHGSGEAQAARHCQMRDFGKTYWTRNAALPIAALLLCATQTPVADALVNGLWLIAALLIVGAELIGRALFYALVIPTTMPGAFFWKNPAFEAHARESGLASMPQLGVQAAGH